jgi:hypothetical protein
MHRALEHAARIGAGEATVWVLDQNARARRFYEARGFRCDDARKLIDLGGATLSEIRYRRSLLLERGRAMPPGARR